MKKFIFILLFAVFGVSLSAFSQEEDLTVVNLEGSWKATPTAQISGTPTICAGESAQLRIDFTNDPLYIVYKEGSILHTISGEELQASPYYLTVSPSTTTIYTLESVVNESCSETGSGAGVVTVNQLPTGNITDVSPTQCYGQADGSATFVPSGGSMPFTYHWDNGVGTVQNNQLNAGLHSITVTDSHGCSASFTTNIPQPEQLQLFVATTTNVNCTGPNSGAATVYAIGGTTPYTYTWSGGQTGPAVSNLSSGTHLVTVTDHNNCQTSISISIGTDPMLAATITSHTNVLCAGSNTGNATVTATGGTSPYSYNWSNGQNSQTASGLAAGTYVVTVTDVNSCTAVATPVTINQPPQLVATLTVDDVNCMGTPLGSATVSVNGGVTPYSYNWSTGAMTSSITNLAQGGYSLTVKDANNCMASGSPFYFTVGQDPVPVANAIITSGSSSCGGSDVVLLASGGESYLWSTGATTPEITVNPLVPTWYYVTVSNSYGCSDVDSIQVLVNPMPQITFNLPMDICSDGDPITLASLTTVTPANGQPWFTGNGVAGNVFYPSTVAVGGTYDITAHYTDPVTGCYNAVTERITVHHPPTTTLNIPQGSLCLSSAPLVLTGGVPAGGVYSGNGVNNGVFNPAVADTGTHQIKYTYTDPYGCVAFASDNIVVHAPTNVHLSTPATEMCTGDAPINLTAYPSGGYYMVDGESAMAHFDPAYWGPGVHIVTYTLTSAMCGGDDTVTITVYETPVVTLDCPVSVEENSAPVLLVVSPPGGELTVNGQLSGVYFDPAYWGPGTHNIVYTYTNSICEASVSRQITVGPVSVGEHPLIDISVFPNPVSDILNIELGDNVDVSEIQLFDVMGKMIYSKGVDSDNNVSIDMSELTPTMYYVRFVMQDGQVSKPVKVLKQ